MAKTEDNRGFFDLKKQFTFYGSYHNHPVNVAIHLVCIWQILWSFIALLQYTPAIVSTPSFVTSLSPILTHVSINGAFFFSLIYIVCYPIMDPAAGSLGALLVVALYVATGILVQTTATIAGFSLLKVLGLFNASMWIAQFLGHGIFEGRAPALLDSWDQALITRPSLCFSRSCSSLGTDRSSTRTVCSRSRRTSPSLRNPSRNKDSKEADKPDIKRHLSVHYVFLQCHILKFTAS